MLSAVSTTRNGEQLDSPFPAFLGPMLLAFKTSHERFNPGNSGYADSISSKIRSARVVVETAIVLQTFIEYVFTGMPKRRMPYVMS